MRNVQISDLTVSYDETLRATVRVGSSSQDVFVDLYNDDEVREAVGRLYNVVAARVGAGAKKCDDCIGTCCTALAHDEIELSREDVERLANHLYLHYEDVVAKYLVPTHSLWGEYQFVFAETRLGLACPLLDTEKFRCSVYEARPSVCRAFSADACDQQRSRQPDVERVRWGKLLPADRLVRRQGKPVIERNLDKGGR